MAQVLGLLPMAGSGSRLGLPFPKPLAPTITDAGIRPLYSHAYENLRTIAHRVVMVVPPDGSLDGLPGETIRKPERGELPSSLALVARKVHPDTIIAVALPDSIWRGGMTRLLVRYLIEQEPIDGVLGLFEGPADVLDRVETDPGGFVQSIETHGSVLSQEAMPEGNACRDGKTDAPKSEGNSYLCRTIIARSRGARTVGWGCLVSRAGCLAGLTDERPLGPQLSEYRFAAVPIDSPYLDLGTPERYIAHHDLRTNGHAA